MKHLEFFWALLWGKTQIKLNLTPPFSAPLWFAFSLLFTYFQSFVWSSLYFFLTLLFDRYSPFHISLFKFLLPCFCLLCHVVSHSLSHFLDSLAPFTSFSLSLDSIPTQTLSQET